MFSSSSYHKRQNSLPFLGVVDYILLVPSRSDHSGRSQYIYSREYKEPCASMPRGDRISNPFDNFSKVIGVGDVFEQKLIDSNVPI